MLAVAPVGRIGRLAWPPLPAADAQTADFSLHPTAAPSSATNAAKVMPQPRGQAIDAVDS